MAIVKENLDTDICMIGDTMITDTYLADSHWPKTAAINLYNLAKKVNAEIADLGMRFLWVNIFDRFQVLEIAVFDEETKDRHFCRAPMHRDYLQQESSLSLVVGVAIDALRNGDVRTAKVADLPATADAVEAFERARCETEVFHWTRNIRRIKIETNDPDYMDIWKPMNAAEDNLLLIPREGDGVLQEYICELRRRHILD